MATGPGWGRGGYTMGGKGGARFFGVCSSHTSFSRGGGPWGGGGRGGGKGLKVGAGGGRGRGGKGSAPIRGVAKKDY